MLKLSCTADDMRPLGEAAGFDPPVHKWNPRERAELIDELDAAFFLLYGIDRDDADYILGTFSGTEAGHRGEPHVLLCRGRIGRLRPPRRIRKRLMAIDSQKTNVGWHG